MLLASRSLSLYAAQLLVGTGAAAVAIVGRNEGYLRIEYLVNLLGDQFGKALAKVGHIVDGCFAEAYRWVVVRTARVLDEQQGRRYRRCWVLSADDA